MSSYEDLHVLVSKHSYLPIHLNPVLPPLVSDFYGHTRVTLRFSGETGMMSAAVSSERNSFRSWKSTRSFPFGSIRGVS